ncbi:polyisoprenoid-binding protein YceI [Roseiarcus fermentans]|uniref:Polyisoprenoid-binding protein YceI n=1 Tax=Roseiarcus fermentans TaxID=1473586 RepID=A0A366EY14_9HYPH|nr:YceI family protein [Roseiarcus fermentans]RBP07282.1 polyisoprenoid-binding protein YceI [Roseiarcus fermentans]
MRFLAPLALASFAALGVSAPAFAGADYKIDPSHTHVLFMVDHLGFSKMIGLFGDTTGAVAFDPANPAASKLSVDIKTASLQSQFGPRDTDLKGADWFNVAEFPDMTFVGKTFKKTGDKSGELTGDLTLLGVTKPVTLEVAFNKAGVRPTDKADAVGFSARGSLNRSDFGLKTYIPYIGDKVDLIIESEAIR